MIRGLCQSALVFLVQVSGWGDRDRDLIVSSVICTAKKES